MTGGSSFRNASVSRSITWLAQIMRWVLMTAFGLPVEPDVSRNFAIVSGPMPRAPRRGADAMACHQVCQRGDVAAGHGAARRRDFGASGHVGGQRIGEFRGIVGEHEAGVSSFIR